MTSGWTRWVLEQYEFPFEVVYPQTLDNKDLNARSTCWCSPRARFRRASGARASRGPRADNIPEEYRERTGRITADKTIPRLRKFVEGGGSLVAIGSSTCRGRVVRPAGEEPPGRERFRRQGPPARPREVLHSGVAAHGESGREQPARLRHARAGVRVLQQQPGVPAAAGGAVEGRPARGVVRGYGAARERLGVGPALPGRRDGGGGSGARRRQGVLARPGGGFPRAAARHLQAAVSTGSTTARRRPAVFK